MINNTFYTLKPLIPRRIQIFFRRLIARYQRNKNKDIWPIDPKTSAVPEGWKGWPENKKFALVLSHDVDTQKGHDRVNDLLNIEKRLGFKSAFNFVPERYTVSKKLLEKIKKERFEVNVHGLKHDGKLFKSRKIFEERAQRINHYLEDWQSEGFTAPSMICNLEWIHALKIQYSTCTFDTDPFEPAPNPSGTIFPFAVKNTITAHTFIELPYTLPQDHALFIILDEIDIEIWKKKLAWLVDCGGMALLNTHPDYMGFNGSYGPEEYPKERFEAFLTHISTEYQGQYWHALPSEMARFWKSILKTDHNE
jgi:hypothetical protein